MGDAEQQLRNINGDSFRIIGAAFKLSFVGKSEDRKATHPPGIRESRLQRTRFLFVSIIRKENPSLALAAIPERAVVEIAGKLKIGKSHKIERNLGKNARKAKRFE
jgi:hypothetical protein